MPRPSPAAAMLLLATLAPAALVAQRVDAAPLVLRLPPSARSLAMGGGQPAEADPEAMLASPALLGGSRGASAQVERYGDAGTLGVLASATPALGGVLGIGVAYLDFGTAGLAYPRAARDAAGALSVRGPVAAASLAASVGYARRVLGLRTGVVAKYVEERLGAARDGSLAADVGASVVVFQQSLAVSLAVQNLGPGLRLAGTHAPLPTRVALGASAFGYPLSPTLDVGASGSVAVVRGGRVEAALGGEAAYVPIEGYALAARAGVRRAEPGTRPFTAGAGFTRDRVSLDYAFEPYEGGRAGHRVGIRVQ